jgi:hypothetical protein
MLDDPGGIPGILIKIYRKFSPSELLALEILSTMAD